MKQEKENRRLATAYLMAEMTDPERDAFEERLFVDPDLSDSVDGVETDLIDEYLRGEFTDTERDRFATHFLISDRRREKLAAASVLHRYLFARDAGTAPDTAASFWDKLKSAISLPSPALAGIAVVILILVAATFFLIRQPGHEIVKEGETHLRSGVSESTGLEPPEQEARTAPPAGPANAAPNAPSAEETRRNGPAGSIPPERHSSPKNGRRQSETRQPVRTFAFTLLPVTRSGVSPEFVVPSGAESINIKVVHNNKEAFVKYRIELRDSEGEIIWSREIANKAARRSLSVNLPSGLLRSGPHELALLGIDEAGHYTETNFYNFSVKRK